MRYRNLVLFLASMTLMMVISVPIAGQAPQEAAPRTAWGDPDLQGIWQNVIRLPLQRSQELGTKEFWTETERATREAQMIRDEQAKIDRRVGKLVVGLGERAIEWMSYVGEPRKVQFKLSRRTSAIVDPPNGRLPPWTAAAVKRWETREAARRGRGESDSVEDRAWDERCVPIVHATLTPGLMLPVAPPTGPGEFDQVASQMGVSPGPQPTEILQMPGYVVIVAGSGMTGSKRQIIPLDGRPAPGPKVRQFLGDQRGRWEGNTLIVETTNVNDQQDGGTFIPSRRTPTYPGSGETLRLIERYTRLGPDTLEYRYTIDDPQTYTRPWTAVYELTSQRRPDMVELPLWCHENNRGLSHFLAGARAEQELSIRYAEEAARDRLQRLEQLKAEWAGLAKETGSR